MEESDYAFYCGPAIRDKALHNLKGLLNGVAIDHSVNTLELSEVRDWTIAHSNEVEKDLVISELVTTVRLAFRDGVLTPEEAEDIRSLCDRAQSTSPYYAHATHLIQELHGLLHGIIADLVVNQKELSGLIDWFEENAQSIKTFWPVTEVESLVIKIMADGKIDEKEHKMLLAFFGQFSDLSVNATLKAGASLDIPRSEMMTTGICAVDPEIVFPNRIFCFTGRSSRGLRRDFAGAVESMKGIFIDSIRADLDYLVIGNEGNPCWAFSCYGRKVEKVVQMRKAGKPVLLVHENDFWDSIA